MSRLRLLEISRATDQLSVACAFDDFRFHFTVWYQDVDLNALAREHGDELMDRLSFHIAMFQINALCSLRPDSVELGRYARFATPRFLTLWRTVFRRVWAQWRWEHRLPEYEGPRFVDADGAPAQPVATSPGPVELLAFCGGGKDSLVALKLLERGGLPFATLGYAHSVYGSSSQQHVLLDRLGAASARTRAERQWVTDDFLDSPIVTLHRELGVESILAAETPASLFAALPLALARGYRGLVVAHEASANSANLSWGAEQVNHQWGKSWEAEVLLDAYVRSELLADVRYFSLLQPVHDELIFELLRRDAALVPLTHSCNVRKPWCGSCAKCAYVWLQMAAHLPPTVVEATFKDNLGERSENEVWFRQLLGLADHTPFECVGSAAEARLALALLQRPLGDRLARLAAEVGSVDVQALAAPLVRIGEAHGMPPHVAAAVMPQLENAASVARRRFNL
jgi:hypothetical protein